MSDPLAVPEAGDGFRLGAGRAAASVRRGVRDYRLRLTEKDEEHCP